MPLVVGVMLTFMRSHRARNWGRASCLISAVLLLLLGWRALPESLIESLEDRYASPQGDLSGFEGMVVLGGVFAGYDGRHHRLPALGGAADRVVQPTLLMNQYRDLRLLFTGGAAFPSPWIQPEARFARVYFERMGTDMNRMLFESQSRNTYENATLSRSVSTVDIRRPWLLVTSASHMPRALATFQKAGWNVTPYPVNYFSARETQWASYSLPRGIEAWNLAIHEYAGFAAYHWLGRL